MYNIATSSGYRRLNLNKLVKMFEIADKYRGGLVGLAEAQEERGKWKIFLTNNRYIHNLILRKNLF